MYPGPSIGGCFARKTSFTSSPRPGLSSGQTLLDVLPGHLCELVVAHFALLNKYQEPAEE